MSGIACFAPKPALWTPDAPGGKHLKFIDEGLDLHLQKPEEVYVNIPCRKCAACRMRHQSMRATQGTHELFETDECCFLTLTYAPWALPPGGLTCLPDFQKLMKRLRKKAGPGVRFLQTIEYGDKRRRTHAHIVLFGLDLLKWLPDLQPEGNSAKGNIEMWRSRYFEEEIWGMGRVMIQPINRASAAAAYATKYCMLSDSEIFKPYVPTVTLGELAELCNADNGSDRYQFQKVVDRYGKWWDGQNEREQYRAVGAPDRPFRLHERWDDKIPFPAKSTQSKMDGALGTKFLRRYWSDIYVADRCIMMKDDEKTGKQFQVATPRAYDLWVEREMPEMWKMVQQRRRDRMADPANEIPGTYLDHKGRRRVDWPTLAKQHDAAKAKASAKIQRALEHGDH